MPGSNVDRKITPPIIHQTSQQQQQRHSRRRLSLSTNSGPDPSPNCFELDSGKKSRHKSRGMMSIFGNSYDSADGRKFCSTNPFSPVDDTLVEHVAHVTNSVEPSKKMKKKKSRSKIPSKDVEIEQQRLTLPNISSRRHSVSVVITAPPIQSSASPVSYDRRRRRSQGVAASTDYFNDVRRLSESHDAVDENVATEESRPTSPYIRPPIVVVSSANRRKFSLQCDYDVRKMLNVLNVCKILKEIWRELRNSIFSISSM